MNEKEGLNLLDFLATGINKEDTAIKAILSDENGKGAIANEAEELVRFIDYYTRTDDVRDHRDKSLEMIVKQFTKLRRRVAESDEVLLRRFLALTSRKGDDIWGTALNLKHVFETYFKDITCYVAENTNKNSILNNGDFELDDAWTLQGGAVYSYDARFSGNRGVYLSGAPGELCVQRLERLILAGNYAFHFFLHGKCGVIIESENGKYWNANDQVFSGDVILEWVDEEFVNIFQSPDGWEDVFCFLVMPEDARSLTIKFVGIEDETAYIDYARLFVKPLNMSYTLIFQFMGYTITNKSLHLGAVGEDPIQEIDYENESYFDRAFIVGPIGVAKSQAFKSVLDLVRPRGIQAFTEFVEKNVVEEG